MVWFRVSFSPFLHYPRHANICCYFDSLVDLLSMMWFIAVGPSRNRTKFNLFTFLFTHSINVNTKLNKSLSEFYFWSNKAQKQIAVNVRATSISFLPMPCDALRRLFGTAHDFLYGSFYEARACWRSPNKDNECKWQLMIF